MIGLALVVLAVCVVAASYFSGETPEQPVEDCRAGLKPDEDQDYEGWV